ncbi:PAS domain-containing protein [Streptomyces mirabilis]|uniref:PAS domain-containing protein n=1 Tax=Streptomyces mirabilis TaxID=68239 RepID=UPI00338E276B
MARAIRRSSGTAHQVGTMAHSHAWPGPLPPGSARLHVDTAIAVSDPSGQIFLWSSAAQALWGYAPEEVIGTSRNLSKRSRQVDRSNAVLGSAGHLVPAG